MDLPHVYLASSSPRRGELLRQLGILFAVLNQDEPETRLPGEGAEDFVQRLALAKAHAGWRQLETGRLRPVLGADTVVVLDDESGTTRILGKPRDRSHGLAMLEQLSGGHHRVLSAVAMVGTDNLVQDKDRVRSQVRCSESRVWFRALTPTEAEAYWDSGEPLDKAGAYGIQGLAALFIERLEGSYSGVMGLPLFETGQLLADFGLDILPAK